MNKTLIISSFAQIVPIQVFYNQLILMKYFFPAVASLMLTGLMSCGPQMPAKAEAGGDNAFSADSIRFEITNEDFGWGYKVFLHDRQIIYQPFIPATGGRLPFADSADARKTAQLVVNKIRKHIFPPALSIAELDSLGIIYPTKL